MAVQKVVGALDCRIHAQRVQNAQSGHLLPAVATTLSSRDYKGPSCGRDGVTGNPIPVIPTWPAEISLAVRRLTPVECERLQGFPDGYTDIRPSGKDTPDGPRYKALGNSMAVPVMRWIGERIAKVEDITKG